MDGHALPTGPAFSSWSSLGVFQWSARFSVLRFMSGFVQSNLTSTGLKRMNAVFLCVCVLPFKAHQLGAQASSKTWEPGRQAQAAISQEQGKGARTSRQTPGTGDPTVSAPP